MRAPVLPAPGVTVLAPSYALAPGGKGANAACACAVTGRGRNRIAMTSAFVDVFDVVVKFVGAVGDDAFGAMQGPLSSCGYDAAKALRLAGRAAARKSAQLAALSASEIEMSVVRQNRNDMLGEVEGYF